LKVVYGQRNAFPGSNFLKKLQTLRQNQSCLVKLWHENQRLNHQSNSFDSTRGFGLDSTNFWNQQKHGSFGFKWMPSDFHPGIGWIKLFGGFFPGVLPKKMLFFSCEGVS